MKCPSAPGINVCGLLLWFAILVVGCAAELPRGSEEVARALPDYLALGRAYLEQGDLGNARRHLANAARIETDHSEVLALRAMIQAREGDMALAEENFQRALRADPDNTRARNNYAAFLYAEGRLDEAHDHLQRVVADSEYPGRAQAFENLGLTAWRLSLVDEAKNAFERALQLNPRQSGALLGLSELCLDQQALPLANQYYSDYLSLLHDHGHRHDARSLWQGIRLARAEGNSAWEQALQQQLQADFPEAMETRIYRQYLNNE